MLMGYRFAFASFLMPGIPSHRGPVNTLTVTAVTLDHAFKEVVTPNADTPYSMTVLDLLPEISVTFWDIASGLVYLIMIPLAISLFVRARYPEMAESAQPHFAQASNLSLLILMVLMVVLNFSNVIGLLGSGGLLSSLILVLLTTGGGYLLGSLGKADGLIQALGAGQRNIAAAMVVATMNFGNDEVVMVVVYSLIVLAVLIPLALELGKRQSETAEAKT